MGTTQIRGDGRENKSRIFPDHFISFFVIVQRKLWLATMQFPRNDDKIPRFASCFEINRLYSKQKQIMK